jgi:signal transduction histidine kinase
MADPAKTRGSPRGSRNRDQFGPITPPLRVAAGNKAPVELTSAKRPAASAEDPAKRADIAAAAPPGEPSDSDKLQFLAMVSHEVRTPLNSILGFTELMIEEQFGPIGNARYRSYIEDIHQSGLYALSLLNDLLDISKVEAGQFELDFAPVELSALVEWCVSSLSPLAHREAIALRVSLEPALPPVLADPRRLKQILLNLLSNAVKFTGSGGRVTVSAKVLGSGDLRLRVRDNGVGMSKEEIAFSLQPFKQLATAPRERTGTGLGLPLAKALVEANGARLLIASKKGEGTTADVIFPRDRLVTG